MVEFDVQTCRSREGKTQHRFTCGRKVQSLNPWTWAGVGSHIWVGAPPLPPSEKHPKIFFKKTCIFPVRRYQVIKYLGVLLDPVQCSMY